MFSEQERNTAIKNFIVGRYHGSVKISTFEAMVPYLEEKRINLLYDLKHGSYSYGKGYYIENDAEEYFEWLISVVTGARKTSENIIKQANDQLFIFIHTLRDDTKMDNRVTLLVRYNWEEKVGQLIKKFDAFQSKINTRDEKLTHLFTQILEWMKEYRPLLDEVKKDYGDKLGRVLKK